MQCSTLLCTFAIAWRTSQYLAGWTGLEPATLGVTGRYSNQLSYHPKKVASSPTGLLADAQNAERIRHLRLSVRLNGGQGFESQRLARPAWRSLLAMLAINGSPTWARTRDLRINSPSLYRLSYQGKFVLNGLRFH